MTEDLESAATPMRGPASRGDSRQRSADPSAESIRAGGGRELPAMDITPPAVTDAAPPPLRAHSAGPTAEALVAAAMAAMMPPRPALQAAGAARDSAAAGLHIGTLEVRVVAPVPTFAPPARPVPSAPRRGIDVGRSIARGFRVFGLGQS